MPADGRWDLIWRLRDAFYKLYDFIHISSLNSCVIIWIFPQWTFWIAQNEAKWAFCCRPDLTVWAPDSFTCFHSLSNKEASNSPHESSGHASFAFAACFLLGNSPASEFYMPTFRNTVFHLHRPTKMEQSHSEQGDSLKSRILLFCHRDLDTFLMQLTVPSYLGFNGMGQAAETNDKQSYVIRAERRTLSTNCLASPFLTPAVTKDR